MVQDWIIVGLGNPGDEFSETRHNLGFMAVNAMAAKKGSSWRSNRKKAKICDLTIAGRKVLLVKPQTYMNLSGEAVARLLVSHRIPPERIIVIHDDLDLELGRLRIKIGGGDGGHRGVASITESLKTPDFVRVRLGIGRPPAGVNPREFVLTSFTASDTESKEDLIRNSIYAVRLILSKGVERAQNTLHSKN